MGVDLERELESWQQQNQERFDWLRQLIEEFAETTQKLKNANIDLETERFSKRGLHHERGLWRTKFEELQRGIDQSSFVLVLIDADHDGYVFDEKYLVRGVQGSLEAAHLLSKALKDYLEKKFTELSPLPLVIKLYANVEKLYWTMMRCGSTAAAGQLKKFIQGFCQFGGLVDFIDIGDGKEQADHQIKGVFEQFKGNPTCKHIVLGACHDNGYARNLNVIVPEETVRSKITLLKSFQTGAEYNEMPFGSTRFSSLFRNEALSLHGSPRTPSAPLSGHGRTQAFDSAPVAVPNKSYASAADTIANTLPTHYNPNSVSLRGPLERYELMTNSRGERIDCVLDPVPPSARLQLNLTKKARKAKPCNGFVLNGLCPVPRPQKCFFFHDELSEAEKLVVRSDLRRQVCKAGLGCKDPECWYGHNCQCIQAGCKFPSALHNVDRGVLKKVRCV